MRRIKRILSLFLTSILLLGMNVQAQPTNTLKDEVARLEVKVNGNGIVTIDDYESKYELKEGENFKANTILNTELKLSINSNEGFSIGSIVINGNELSDTPKDEKAYSFEYTVSENSDIRVSFIEEKVIIPPVIEEDVKVEISQENIDKEEIKNEEVKEEDPTEKEGLDLKIIKEYVDGINNTKEQIEFRKNLATEKKLLEFVDENFFLKGEFINSKSSAYFVDEEIITLIPAMSSAELEAYANTLSNEIDFILDEGNEELFKDKLSNFFTVLFGNENKEVSTKALITGGGMGVTEVYNGYAVTAPMLSVNGKQAFCIQFDKPTPSAGTVATNQRVSTNDMLRKILYYGYRGPGAGSVSSKWTSNQNLFMIATTQAASKANGHLTYNVGRDFYDDVSKLASPPSGFTVYTVSTGGGTQDLAYWENVSSGTLQIQKTSSDTSVTDRNNNYSVTGAVYGVFKNSNATTKVGTLTIDGTGWSNIITLPPGTYYIKEEKSPKGYSLDKTIYSVTVKSGSKATATYKDTPILDPVGMIVKKIDADTGNNVPSGAGTLENAEFTVKFYGGDYPSNIDPALNGIKPNRTWVLKTDKDGYSELSDKYKVSGDAFYIDPITGRPSLPLGNITIEETKAPNGYILDSMVHIRKITLNSSATGVTTFNPPIIKEQSANLKLKKVQEGTNVGIRGTKFNHTKPNGTVETIVTGTGGNLEIKGLAQGIHRLVESEVVEGYELSSDAFVFEVSGTGITVIQAGGIFKYALEKPGVGYVEVSNSLKPYDVVIEKSNDIGTMLKGAEFTLYSDKDGKNIISTQVTGADGKLKFTGLKDRTNYYFKETKYPDGYQIGADNNGEVKMNHLYVEATPAEDRFDFYVNGNKYTVGNVDTTKPVYLGGTKSTREVHIKIINKRSFKLPNTGSALMIPLVIVGIGLMVFALKTSGKKKKDEKNQEDEEEIK